MSTEQRALLKLAEENATNAVAFLKKGYPQLAREQCKHALGNIDLAEMLGVSATPAPAQKEPLTIEV